MDQLAACHFVHGFLRVPFHRRHHATSPSCKNVKVGSRSLSLTDRRGIISPARSTSKGLISPMSTGQRTRSKQSFIVDFDQKSSQIGFSKLNEVFKWRRRLAKSGSSDALQLPNALGRWGSPRGSVLSGGSSRRRPKGWGWSPAMAMAQLQEEGTGGSLEKERKKIQNNLC